jgi:hypothetical protein
VCIFWGHQSIGKNEGRLDQSGEKQQQGAEAEEAPAEEASAEEGPKEGCEHQPTSRVIVAMNTS